MCSIVTTTGCLHCEFVILLFLETHRETERFFGKVKVGHIVVKPSDVRINLNIDDTPMDCKRGVGQCDTKLSPHNFVVCGMYVGCMYVVCNHDPGPWVLGTPDPRCTSVFVSNVNILIPRPPTPTNVH